MFRWALEDFQNKVIVQGWVIKDHSKCSYPALNPETIEDLISLWFSSPCTWYQLNFRSILTSLALWSVSVLDTFPSGHTLSLLTSCVLCQRNVFKVKLHQYVLSVVIRYITSFYKNERLNPYLQRSSPLNLIWMFWGFFPTVKPNCSLCVPAVWHCV